MARPLFDRSYDPDRYEYNKHHLLYLDFYKHPRALENMCEILFRTKRRGSSFVREIYLGFVQYFSCLYMLPVLHAQMKPAGYKEEPTIVVTAACSGIACIIAGLIANLPFIIAPPTSVSIWFACYLLEHKLAPAVGSHAVIYSGILLILCGYRPLGKFLMNLIPRPIQVGTAIGIGLITALAGCTEINLVVKGSLTILDIGPITTEIILAFLGVAIGAVAVKYHVHGSFSIVLIGNTLLWWISQSSWPVAIMNTEVIDYGMKWDELDATTTSRILYCTGSLFFLSLLLLSGLVYSFNEMAGWNDHGSSTDYSNGSSSAITNSLHSVSGGSRITSDREEDHIDKEERIFSATPNGRWIFIICGFASIVSGLYSGPPILLSPESAAGIKAGAKTGLSTIVCGFLFCLSSFFAPLFEAIPAAATTPLLIMVGVLLFKNVNNIDWSSMSEAVPAFCVLFFIPFTYSILQGVMMGLMMYLLISICSENFTHNVRKIWNGGVTRLAYLFYHTYLSSKDTFLVNMGTFSEHTNDDEKVDRSGDHSSDRGLDREALLGY